MSLIKTAPNSETEIRINYSDGYSIGDTVMSMDGFLDQYGSIKEGFQFTINNNPQVYTVIEDCNIFEYTATSVNFSPALTVSVANNSKIRFLTDIGDRVVSQWNLTYPIDYLAEADEMLFSLAQEHGIFDSSTIKLPLHIIVRTYLIKYICMRLCEDIMGVNNVETPLYETYKVKYDNYRSQLSEYSQKITYEILTGEVNSIRDRVVSFGNIWRG